MDDAMRERANTALMREMVNIFRNLMSDDHKELDSSLTDLLVAFALSEADRRERECIEAVCGGCASGVTLVKGDYFWMHYPDEDDCDEFDGPCRASVLHDIRNQREQGGK